MRYPIRVLVLVMGLFGCMSCRNDVKTHIYHYSGRAMFPTLSTNDGLVVKVGNGWECRGDIVVFHIPGLAASNLSVTRVVGVENDVIDVISGRLRVNGKEINYSLAQTNISLETEAYRIGNEKTLQKPAIEVCPIIVPGRHVFVVGDNPSSSCDSRYWGPLPITNIVGHIIDITGRSWQ